MSFPRQTTSTQSCSTSAVRVGGVLTAGMATSVSDFSELLEGSCVGRGGISHVAGGGVGIGGTVLAKRNHQSPPDSPLTAVEFEEAGWAPVPQL